MPLLPPPPNAPITIRDYEALPEANHGLYELVEGRLVIGPHPSGPHQHAVLELATQLHAACPADLRVFPGVDVDLQLGPADGPGYSRRPDIVVTTRDAARQADEEDERMLRASEVVLVVEIADAWSAYTDFKIKQAEYESARIGHYWVLDIRGKEPTLWRYPTGDGGAGVVTASEPFPATINLHAFELPSEP